MHTVKILILVPFAFALLSGCGERTSDSGAESVAADTVYSNGKIYTVNEAQPWAEAVAIKDGRFIEVGSNADVESLTGESTVVVDLGGKFVMPGIIDLHTHPFISPWYGKMNLSLEQPDDAEKAGGFHNSGEPRRPSWRTWF